MNSNTRLNIDFIEFILINGRKTFAFRELLDFKAKNQNAAWQYIKNAKRRKLIKNLSDGFYAVYSPPEKDSGFIPPADFINQLLEYRGINYYAGLLTAASFYGAAHYRPAVFQVIADKQVHTPAKMLEGIDFHYKKSFPEFCIVKHKGNYGYINYSSPALTAFDLIKFEKDSGTISNAVNVINDLLPMIKISDVKNLLRNRPEVSYAQRLGFILEKLNAVKPARLLLEYSEKATAYVPLSRLGNKTGMKNSKWKIIENVNTEELIDT
ncbi:MAG: type IV toxin-antitoxin system AbiEi family antitoxin [Ignavibacteria bacterium]|jgi:predicted transcriptional regulator of viral defense system|nr:type IV toxin-antitoxin system AbiEi family antitoxin [Ignavibacteria bacterium]